MSYSFGSFSTFDFGSTEPRARRSDQNIRPRQGAPRLASFARHGDGRGFGGGSSGPAWDARRDSKQPARARGQGRGMRVELCCFLKSRRRFRLMALEIITPFGSDRYRTMVSGFVGWLVEYVQSNQIQGRTGWMSHLQDYVWNGQDWREGIRKRYEFHERVMRAQSDEDFHQVAQEILSWGRMSSFGFEEACLLQRSLTILDTLREGGDAPLDHLFIDRVAASSKIYEMHDPSSWVIYDSRVARGLDSLVATWWKMNGKKTMGGVLRFPWPPGRGDASAGIPARSKNSPETSPIRVYLRQLAYAGHSRKDPRDVWEFRQCLRPGFRLASMPRRNGSIYPRQT